MRFATCWALLGLLFGTTSAMPEERIARPNGRPANLAPVPQAHVDPRVITLPVVDATDLRFTRLSTEDGLSQTRVTQILQYDRGFISFLADRIRDTEAHVVFTAHSLPARILDEGDPYHDQLLETARLVADTAGVEDWSFSFQSESPTGEPWLGPDILDHLADLAGRGIDDMLICPVGFVSDHLEIRWDIDTEAQDRARELGLHLDRIEMPNDDPRFVRALADIVRGASAPVAT